jgi:uncharacterized circularly permuted ATP-grasp superfamily protein/uncharacterized alpha-E superfamily protein
MWSTETAPDLAVEIARRPDLPARQLATDRMLAAEGAGHIVHDLPARADGRTVSLASRPWRLDPIPIVIDAAEFSILGDLVTARMRMLESILIDLYGRRSLLTDRVLDPAQVWASNRYRLAAIGQRAAPRWLTTYAVDVIKGADGRWHVVQDLTDAPPGSGYTFLGRTVLGRVHRDIVSALPRGSSLRSVEPFADQLRDALSDLAGSESPRIVVMSGGVEHPSFVGHSYLASRLGLNLAEGADLVVRRRRLWLRSLAGLEPIDVLHRCLEGDRIDPMEVNALGVVGVPGLLDAVRVGGVRLANGHGTGVIEDPKLAEHLDEAGDWIEHRHRVGDGVAALRRLDAHDRRTMAYATTPCLVGSTVMERRVVVRLQLVASDRGIDVMQGGSARVLEPGDDPTLATSATAKDVWVIGGTVSPPSLPRRQPLPQVDLIASVPTRAAEALFWAGRALERAELVARALDVVLDRTVGVADAESAEPWVTPATAMLAAIAGLPMPADGSGPLSTTAAIQGSLTKLAVQLGSVLAEVSSVREFFSTSAGRAFSRLADARATIQQMQYGNRPISAAEIDSGLIDGILHDLSSVVGLWNESVVRGPAWRFGEIGRRIERVFGVIYGLRGALAHQSFESAAALTQTGATNQSYDSQRLVEIVLATNESLVAYRRRYRSDVEFAFAANLVVSDDRNPRAVASALAIIAREAGALDWSDGVSIADELLDVVRGESFATIEGTMATLDALWKGSDRLARGITSAYLTSPLDPQRMGRVR